MDGLNKRKWHALWQRLGAPVPAGSFEFLQAKYDEPGRHYHNHEHVKACLRHLRDFCHLAEKPDLVELALWGHDVFYDSTAKDNELLSAEWTAGLLRAVGMTSRADTVYRMIMGTQHNGARLSSDEALVVDIDLSILAVEAEMYAEYERLVRKEYAWVSDHDFAAGRAAFLKGMLKHGSIYNHSEIRAQWEQQARHNMKASLRTLTNSAQGEPDHVA